MQDIVVCRFVSYRFIGSGLNSRYEANVDCYEELTQKHCLRYVDDNSTETLSLRQQQILILHNEDLVGRFISLYNETTEEWHRSLKVIYYDEPHKTHVILEPNTGNINSLHLEWVSTSAYKYLSAMGLSLTGHVDCSTQYRFNMVMTTQQVPHEVEEEMYNIKSNYRSGMRSMSPSR
eukprot:m.168499 g.168499  ORF g.168499 m.168499 type:complete len:177 (+) comp14752_c0_seq3:1080-1610(+)